MAPRAADLAARRMIPSRPSSAALPLLLLAAVGEASAVSGGGILSRLGGLGQERRPGFFGREPLRRQGLMLTCKANKKKPRGALEEMFNTDLPIDNMAMFGGAGLVTGYVTMKIGKSLLFVGGALAIGANLLEKNGYLAINWDKIQKDMTQNERFKQFDRNKDGKIGVQEVLTTVYSALAESNGLLQSTLAKNFEGVSVASGSFAAGFFLGATFL